MNLVIEGGLNEQKVHHNKLILEGVCSACAHCGQPLTDSVSIESGIGPICSKKGYKEEPVVSDVDETDALIFVAPWTDLMEFLVERLPNHGRRGLMNGLVRACSLNRSNKQLVKACCDSIEALGWKRLANTIRESCTVLVISKCKHNDDFLELRVKRAFFKWEMVSMLRAIPGQRLEKRPNTHNLIPRSQKAALWQAIVACYPGECGKGEEGGFKIPESLEG